MECSEGEKEMCGYRKRSPVWLPALVQLTRGSQTVRALAQKFQTTHVLKSQDPPSFSQAFLLCMLDLWGSLSTSSQSKSLFISKFVIKFSINRSVVKTSTANGNLLWKLSRQVTTTSAFSLLSQWWYCKCLIQFQANRGRSVFPCLLQVVNNSRYKLKNTAIFFS